MFAAQTKDSANNRISQISITSALKTLLSVREIRKAGFKLIGTINSVFFKPQFLSRIGLNRKQVIRVDHPLDSLIPFSPAYVKDYLCFTHLWVKSLAFLYKEFGREALGEILSFISEIEGYYTKAFQIYGRYQSTTRRPAFAGGPPFYIIRLLDPHLHCLPSLHVIIVSFAYYRISAVLDKLAQNMEDYRAEKDHLFNMAVRIINSVLFTKQHSVNCIPAGLFMLQSTTPDFTADISGTLLDNILRRPEIPEEIREKILGYMKNLISQFSRQKAYSASEDILIDFLENYPPAESDIDTKHIFC